MTTITSAETRTIMSQQTAMFLRSPHLAVRRWNGRRRSAESGTRSKRSTRSAWRSARSRWCPSAQRTTVRRPSKCSSSGCRRGCRRSPPTARRRRSTRPSVREGSTRPSAPHPTRNPPHPPTHIRPTSSVAATECTPPPPPPTTTTTHNASCLLPRLIVHFLPSVCLSPVQALSRPTGRKCRTRTRT